MAHLQLTARRLLTIQTTNIISLIHTKIALIGYKKALTTRLLAR